MPASQIASLTRTNDAYAWTGHANVDRNYTTNGLNQYTAAGPASFTYDANGNLCRAAIWMRKRDNQDENPVCVDRRRA